MGHQPSKEISINGHKIGLDHPTYFITDIAANHDGDLERAKELIYLAAEAGADAVKFQHFSADTIVSDYGFKSLNGQQSHQKSWKKSVYEVYQDASINLNWTEQLKATAEKAGVHFFTSPYSFELVDEVDPYVPAYKIGSGDITWIEIIEYMAKKGKPMLLATGASDMVDVEIAVDALLNITSDAVLMQCNTNYTGSIENFKYINLNVLKTYAERFPGMILGLSDHTPGCTSVLGAVAFGARVIEKHFTNDKSRTGPDHGFSLNPADWREMVDRTRELENSLGDGIKRVEDNEKETVVLQRRAIRANRDIKKGEVISANDIFPLRPCPTDGIPPYKTGEILNRVTISNIKQGDIIRWTDLK